MAYWAGSSLGYLWTLGKYTPNRGDGCECGWCFVCLADSWQRKRSPEELASLEFTRQWVACLGQGPAELSGRGPDWIPF